MGGLFVVKLFRDATGDSQAPEEGIRGWWRRPRAGLGDGASGRGQRKAEVELTRQGGEASCK